MNGGIQGDQEFLDTHVVIPRAEVERLREGLTASIEHSAVLEAEVERLREERDRLREEEVVAHAYLARLHRIEEAARGVLDDLEEGMVGMSAVALRVALEQ